MSLQFVNLRGQMLASGLWLGVPAKLETSLWYGLPTYRQDSAVAARSIPVGGSCTLRAFGLFRWNLGFFMLVQSCLDAINHHACCGN